RWMLDWTLVGVLPVLGVLAWAAWRPLSSRALARRVDAHYGTHDAIGNALEFCAPSVSYGTQDARAAEFARLAIESGELAARDKSAALVVPIRIPGLRRIDLLAAALLAASFATPERPFDEEPSESTRELAVIEDPVALRAAGTDMTLADPLREELARLREGEDAASKTADEILEVLAALERGEIDR